MVVFLFVDFSLFKDGFHENRKEIYLVENVIDRDGNIQVWGDTPFPLGPMLKADYPQIERVVRLERNGADVRYGDKVFNEGILFAEDEFLDMFTFDLKWGDKSALKDLNAVILNEKIARKFFDEENPIGKELQLTFRDSTVKNFVIKGVTEKIPQSASFDFSLLLNWEIQRSIGVDVDSWKGWTDATFIQVPKKADLPLLAQGQEKYLQLQNAANEDWPATEFLFDELLHLPMTGGGKVRGTITSDSPPEAIITLFIIGIFLLLLACLNYMNIAVASATRRLKEIGIRKVSGSSRAQLIAQFLTENVMLCLLALLFGLLLGEFLFIPAFNSWVNNGPTDIVLQYGESLHIYIFLALLLFFTGIGAGFYPAVVVSGFPIVTIFKGKLKLGRKSWFTRIFLTVQFLLAFVLIIAGILFTQNVEYQKNKDWGYDQESILVIPAREYDQFQKMQDLARQHPNVKAQAASLHHIGRSHRLAVVDYQGTKLEFDRLEVGPNYPEVMGLRLVTGRNFDIELISDQSSSIIVNETMVKNMEWEDPIGKQFRFDSTLWTVIGVVEDYYYENFFNEIKPTFFRLAKEESYRTLTLRVEAGKLAQTADYFKKEWEERIPEDEYRGYFQDAVFEEFYRESQGISNIFVSVAVIALLLSCMGLYGLISLVVAKRMKEFSIRKVLGASVNSLARLVNRQFVWLLLIAGALASPLAYMLLGGLLESIFPYHVPMNPWPFVIAGIAILGTSLVTISGQLFKVAKANPVDALRDE
jgi:ABC-type antimicrobial peptide transport system permease subunit